MKICYYIFYIIGIKNHYFDASAMNGGFLPFSITYSRLPVIQKPNDSLSSEESKYFRYESF